MLDYYNRDDIEFYVGLYVLGFFGFIIFYIGCWDSCFIFYLLCFLLLIIFSGWLDDFNLFDKYIDVGGLF